MTTPREVAQKLVRLAADDRTPDKERVAAALKAAGLINEHSLLDSPLDGIGDLLRSKEGKGAARAAGKVYDVLTDPDIAAALKSISRRVSDTTARRRR